MSPGGKTQSTAEPEARLYADGREEAAAAAAAAAASAPGTRAGHDTDRGILSLPTPEEMWGPGGLCEQQWLRENSSHAMPPSLPPGSTGCSPTLTFRGSDDDAEQAIIQQVLKKSRTDYTAPSEDEQKDAANRRNCKKSNDK